MRTHRPALATALLAIVLLSMSLAVGAANMSGYVLDPNWYAEHPKFASPTICGSGMFEYGVAGNISYSSALGLFSSTENYADNYGWGAFGFFRQLGRTDGAYTLATWDNWWRSSYLFGQSFAGSDPAPVVLRLHANMWSYGPTWEANYLEFGQTFAATGSSVVMVVVRSAANGQITASIHDGGPTGPQIGPSRTAAVSAGPTDTRFVWNGGELPTVPGHVYYLKLLGSDHSQMLCNNEPVPDLSDAMPEGYAYHNGLPWYQTSSSQDLGKSMDLGVTICSDDDGILTNMFTRPGGQSLISSSVGETFVARGTSLLSFSAWIADAGSTYIATPYSSVGGGPIGTAKRSRTMRAADPQIMWTWAPGECPLTPGAAYYIEITREGGGNVTCQASNYNAYPNGRAYANRVLQADTMDIAGTTMEEEAAGSATMPTVQFASFPSVAFADRGTRTLTIRWTTDVPADSTVEYAAWAGPYTNTYYNSTPVSSHAVTITGLLPNTMYHLRVKGAASGRRTGVTRDFVACTVNDLPNLLGNPDFETGTGASPRKTVPNWYYWAASGGGIDYGESDGTWFHGIPPYTGSWVLEAATNGGSPNAVFYQTVYGLTIGQEYNFTCAVSTWMRENDTWKYDVWDQEGRLSHVKIGIDPWGNNNPQEPNIRWMPRMYSHLRYTTLGIRQVAQANKMTVLISLRGQGGQWHIYGIDDCRFSEANPYFEYPLAELKRDRPDGTLAQVQDLIITATTAQAGAYYAQMADRSVGIRIVSSDTATVGKRLAVRGTLYTDPLTRERSLINAKLSNQVSVGAQRPLTMQCESIGGGALGSTPAVAGSSGPHNTGLLVRVPGRVTAKDSSSRWFYVSDGSLPGNGVRVDSSRLSSIYVPGVGEKVAVTGISSRYFSNPIVQPLILVRTWSDISRYAQ